MWVGAATVAVAVVLGVVVYLATDRGAVQIEFNETDPQVQVTVDAQEWPDRGRALLRLSAGAHNLEVTGPDFDPVHQPFFVHRGDNSPLRVSLQPAFSVIVVGLSDSKAAVELKIDGASHRPGDPVKLRLGDHRVDVTGAGYVPVHRTITVVRGPNPQFIINLEPRPAAPPPVVAEQFRPLFNGADFLGWDLAATAPGVWRAGNGETAFRLNDAPKQRGWLMTRRDYSNFRLRFEYQLDPGANSGVGLRMGPDDATHLEIQLADDRGLDATKVQEFEFTGSLFGVTIDRRADLRPAGEWNRAEIELNGQDLHVTVNGKETVHVFLNDNRVPKYLGRPAAASGRIGFQHWLGGGKFRNVEILERPDSAPGPAVVGPPPNPPADAKPPVSGEILVPALAGLDDVMLKYRAKIGCSAAALAVTVNGNYAVLRAYGWTDQEHRVAAKPNTFFNLGNADSSVNMAAVRLLIAAGRLKLNDRFFKVLKIEPRGKVVDERVMNITIRHVLEQKAGWSGDAIFQAMNTARMANAADADSLETQFGYVMTQKLHDAPGTKAEPKDHTSWRAMRLLIAHLSGQPVADYLRDELFKPFGVRKFPGFAAAGAPETKSPATAVWNAGQDGPICVTAPALAEFLNHYTTAGELRRGPLTGGFGWTMPNSWVTMGQRADGVHYAYLFDGSANATYEEVKAEIERVLDGRK